MKKQSKLKKILSFSFLGLAIILFLSGFFIFDLTSDFKDDLPCYDKFGNKIVGQVCEDYEQQNEEIIMMFPFVFLISILLVCSYYTFPRKGDF